MREVFAEHRPAVVFHAAAYKHVGLMETNPVEAVRNNALAARVMCARGGRLRRAHLHPVSTDKAVEPARSWAPPRRSPNWLSRRPTRAPRRPLAQRALRQRARLLGLGGADLPAPDRGRRAGHGHRPRDDALLHDDPGGGATRDPLRLALLGRRGVRSREGEAVSILELAKRNDRLCGPASRAATSRSRSSAGGPGRSSTRSCSTPTSTRSPPRPSASCAPIAPASTPPGWRTRSTASACSRSRATRPGSPSVVAQLASLRLEPEEPVVLTSSPAADQPTGPPPRLLPRLSWSSSRSRSRTRLRSTARTSASPPSSAWQYSRCSTSRRLAKSSAYASGRGRAPERAREVEEAALAAAEAAPPAPAAGRRPRRPSPQPVAAATAARRALVAPSSSAVPVQNRGPP